MHKENAVNVSFLLACLRFHITLYPDLKDYLLNYELKRENLGCRREVNLQSNRTSHCRIVT